MTTPNDYLTAVRGIMDHLERTQLSAIEQAADLVIEALTHGGTIHCAAIGHSNEADFINRAGGLAAIHPFNFKFEVNSPVADCQKDRPASVVEADIESIRLAVRSSNLRAGDVMLIGSVSGRNRAPVELALRKKIVPLKAVTRAVKTAEQRLPALADIAPRAGLGERRRGGAVFGS